MKILNLQQGTPEWLAHRFNHFNASEAAAMLGLSKKLKRNELLHMKATGNEREFSDYVREVVLASGHAAEAAARPQIEAEIGEPLFPVIGVSDEDPRLSVSFDGLTFGEDLAFECKVWNEELVAQVRAGELREEDFPDHIYQMEQGLLISTSTEEIIFTVAKADGSDKVSMRYRSVPERRAKIIPGWNQFEADLAAYVPPVAKAAPVAAPVEALPAIVYTIDRGTMALQSNLPAFRAATEALVERTKAPLVTDQDFADREALCKKMREAEAMLKAKADEVVGQINDVATFSRELKDLAEMFRAAALSSEKLVEAEKKNRRNAIQQGGEQALAKHVASLQVRFAGRVTMPAIRGDFAGVIKGKRTLDSIQNAVDTELAQRKIEANAVADCITENLVALDNNAPEHLFLFRDLQQIITMPYEAFLATVQGRVATHKAQEQAKLDAERERIAREEREKAEREARAKVEEEQRQAQQQAAQQQPAPAPAATPARAASAAPAPATAPRAAPAPAAPRRAAMPTLPVLIDGLAGQFGISDADAARWLLAIDRTEVQQYLDTITATAALEG